MKPIAAIYIFTIILMSAEIVWIVMRGNRTQQTFSFIMCQILINIWSVSQLFQLEAVNIRQLFQSYCVANTGICWIGTMWLTFSLFSTGKKFRKEILLIPFAFSLVMWLSAVTNPLHYLFYNSFSAGNITYGVLFYINIGYTYICVVIGTVFLCRSLGSDRIHRKQLALLTLSALIPLGSNMLYHFDVINTAYDITPLAFSISSVLVLLVTYRFGFLNVNDLAFDKALDSISEGVAVFGRNGESTYSNRTIHEIFGSEDMPETVRDFISQETQPSETEISTGDKFFKLSRYRNTDKKGNLIAVTLIVTDITRYYEIARQKQALSETREKLAVEHERNRIAQEVHDTVGHTLTMINSLSKLTAISLTQSDCEAAAKYASEAQQLSVQGIAQLRISINNLRGQSEHSLISEGLTQLAESARGVAVDLCIQGEDSMKYSYCSNVIYENTREAITNCVKYSNADRMDIIVKLLNDTAEVYIMDNGKGCSEIKLGNGLRGMRERTEKIGGNIKFNSHPDCGFSITMKFPFACRGQSLLKKGVNND